MTDIQKRNEQILKLLKAGASRRDLARGFDLSVASIAAIQKASKTEALFSLLRARILDELRKADGPEKLWPTADLIHALAFRPIFTTRLLQHFENIGKTELSFRELMDLTALSAGPGYQLPLVLGIRGVGKYGLRDFLKQVREIERQLQPEKFCSE